LVLPPGFIDDSGGGGVGGGLAGGLGAGLGAAGAIADFLGKQVDNLRELIRPLWPQPPGAPNGPAGGVSTPNELQGPANFDPRDNAGRWAGIPGSTATWEIRFLLNYGYYDPYLAIRDTGIPATYTITGPARLSSPTIERPDRFILHWNATGPNGEISGFSANNQNGIFEFGTEFAHDTLNSVESSFRVLGTDAFTGPTPEPEKKRYPPISPPQPATSPPPAPRPATPGLPGPSSPPFPDIAPFTTPAPAPATTPEPTPGPTPGPQPSPNPQPDPRPATTPTQTPFPFLPVILPQVTPNTTTQTNADGSRKTAPIVGPITTPVGNEKIGPITIPTNAPQATLAGIAGEVGRIEQKLAKMIRPPADGDLTDRLGLLGSVLKTIYEEFFTGLPAGGYILSSSCEKDEQGDRIEYQVPILATQNRFDAIFERLDALADLIQTHKDLKQPICRGTQPTGQPVTVNFTQIE
jgi:hypothetical protein